MTHRPTTLTAARTIARIAAIAASAVTSTQTYLDGREVIEHGLLVGATHVAGARWTLIGAEVILDEDVTV